MKVSVDILLTVLLVIFIGSLVAMIIYGELWRIRILTELSSAPVETFDYGLTLNAFISSCIGIVSGASILYILAKKFPLDEKAKPMSTTCSTTAS